jgi:undecaprenyl-diphosphatase
MGRLSFFQGPATLVPLALLWLAMLPIGGSGAGWDEAVLAAFHAGEGTWLAAVAAAFTDIGGILFLSAVSTIAALGLLLRGHIRRPLLLLLIVWWGRLLVELQKLWTDRSRPPPGDHLVTVESLSFPSGHTANSAITYLTLAILLMPFLKPRARLAAIFLAVAITLAVGASRVLLGVHWPSDVIGGWAFGLLWTLGLMALATKGTSPFLRH